MGKLLIVGGLFVLAGLCEIGGGYLVWGWMREQKPLFWGLAGATILALYGVIALTTGYRLWAGLRRLRRHLYSAGACLGYPDLGLPARQV